MIQRVPQPSILILTLIYQFIRLCKLYIPSTTSLSVLDHLLQQGQKDPSSAVDTSQGDRSLFFLLSQLKVVSIYASVINDNYPFYLHNRWYVFSYLHLSNCTWRSKLFFRKERTSVCLCTCHHHLHQCSLFAFDLSYCLHLLNKQLSLFFLHKHKYSLPSYYPHTWEKLYMFLRCPGSYCLLKFISSFGFICNLLAVCCWPYNALHKAQMTQP